MQQRLWLIAGLSLVFYGCTRVPHTADLDAKAPNNSTIQKSSSLIIPPGFHLTPPQEGGVTLPQETQVPKTEGYQTPKAEELNPAQEEKRLGEKGIQPASPSLVR